MRASDIDQIHDAGLISAEQRSAIIEHFKLHRDTNKLLVILSIIGGILVSAGIILLISSNWQNIPGFAKIAGGLAMMLGAHFAGWKLSRDDRHPAVAQGLHLIGSAMFLSNIALVGQIYNLSSRSPNALLLWLAGIAPLPWLLRSKTQYVLTLCAFGLWLGLELNQPGSVLYFDGAMRQCLFYTILGTLFVGLGMALSRSRFPEFASTTEKFGLLMCYISSFPLAIDAFYGASAISSSGHILSIAVSLIAAILLVANLSNTRFMEEKSSRLLWVASLGGLLLLAWLGLEYHIPAVSRFDFRHAIFGPQFIAITGLFIFSLVQINIGVQRRSPWLVNLAITFIGIYIVTFYFELFGSMQTTGLMFVFSGIVLIGLAIILERKRRNLLNRMKEIPTLPTT